MSSSGTVGEAGGDVQEPVAQRLRLARLGGARTREGRCFGPGEPMERTDVGIAGTCGQVGHTGQVNGPRDDDLDWDAILWRPVEDDVQRLRRRIFKASQEGDPKRGSQPAKADAAQPVEHLVSARRVTQRNAGRKTAGIDGQSR